LVRHGEVVVAPAVQDEGAAVRRSLRDLGGEASLADTRFAGHEYGLAFTGAGTVPTFEQSPSFGLSSDERAGCLQTRGERSRAYPPPRRSHRRSRYRGHGDPGSHGSVMTHDAGVVTRELETAAEADVG
jgi:hypothetical protein